MCSKNCIDRLFVNLKVISKITPGKKISQDRQGYIFIDDGIQYTQMIQRWIKGDDRNKTINIIKDLIDTAVYYTRCLINMEIIKNRYSIKNDIVIGKNNYNYENGIYNQNDNIQALAKIQNSLNLSISGLKILKETYTNCQVISSKLEIQIETIIETIDEIKNFMQTGDL